jgi:hypothetical protein
VADLAANWDQAWILGFFNELQLLRLWSSNPRREEKSNAAHSGSGHQGRIQSGTEAPDHQQTDRRDGLEIILLEIEERSVSIPD